jgi:hypothetical protein
MIIEATVNDGQGWWPQWFNQASGAQLTPGVEVALSARRRLRAAMQSPDADVPDRPSESLITGESSCTHRRAR